MKKRVLNIIALIAIITPAIIAALLGWWFLLFAAVIIGLLFVFNA
jgi:hypothetical protein